MKPCTRLLTGLAGAAALQALLAPAAEARSRVLENPMVVMGGIAGTFLVLIGIAVWGYVECLKQYPPQS
jgi:hypothetical protein